LLQDRRMPWTAPTPFPFEGPLTGPDRPMLVAYLHWERTTLLNICAGLTAEQLAARPVATSNLSLLGLLRHLAKVERTWFRQRVGGEAVEPLFDPALGKDHDFDAADPARAEQDYARYRDECARADQAAADVSFDHTFDVRGQAFSVRMAYVHMIGEYGRHNGHADLLREAVDGVTGR
jgi:uncharacterized damage-inducible protein DinB